MKSMMRKERGRELAAYEGNQCREGGERVLGSWKPQWPRVAIYGLPVLTAMCASVHACALSLPCRPLEKPIARTKAAQKLKKKKKKKQAL